MEINYWSSILINVEMRELSADQIFIAGEKYQTWNKCVFIIRNLENYYV